MFLNDPFQSFVNPSSRMVFPLISHVPSDPGKIPGTETDDAVARLPLKGFGLHFVVDMMRARAFKLSDKIRYQKVGRDGYASMHVVCGPAKGMAEHPRRFSASASQIFIKLLFNHTRYHGKAFLGPPDDVKKYF